MAKFTAQIIQLGPANEVLTAVDHDLAAEHLPLAKLEALRAANALPEADRIVISEGGLHVAVCRLENLIAEWT